MPAVPGPDGLKLISTLGRPEWVLIAEIAIAVFSHRPFAGNYRSISGFRPLIQSSQVI